MAQSSLNMSVNIPEVLEETGELAKMTTQYWSKFKTYMFIQLKIRIDDHLDVQEAAGTATEALNKTVKDDLKVESLEYI